MCSLITATPAHLTSWLALFLMYRLHLVAFRYYHYPLPLTSLSTSTPHIAHCVPFIVQKGIWIGSALTPLATNLSLISLSLGLAVI